jgi:peptide/nickel transport system substrate-binding protein
MNWQGSFGARARAGLLGLGLVAALVGAGCGRKQARVADYQDPHPLPAEPRVRNVNQVGQYGGRFVFVTIGDPKTFNPPLANEVSSTDLLNGPLFQGLTSYENADQALAPGLAKEWSHSEDGLTWTFTLRKGLRWSDGEPLTVEDVLFSAKVGLDPNLQSSIRDIMQVGGKVWTFEKIDSLTFAVHLPGKFSAVPEVLGSMYIVPEHKLGEAYKAGKYSEMWGVNSAPSEIVTNGPFVLKEYVPGEKAVLTRNPYYWEVDQNNRRLPYIDEYVFLIVKDLNAMALKFQSGETDLIDPITVDQVPTFEDEQEKGGYKVIDLGPDIATDFFWVNQNPGKDSRGKPYVTPWKLKLFRDVRFRRALSHAVDRDGIVKSVLQGRGVPLYSPMTTGNKAWYDSTVVRFAYDPAKAEALLDEMDLKDRNGDGVRDTPDGKTVEFTLHTNSENPLRKAFGTVVAENLGKVGIRVNFQPLEFNTLITRIRSDYQYEAILLGLAGATPPDPFLSGNVYRSTGLTHNWNPRQTTPSTPGEAEMDRLMDVVVGEPDYALRKQAFDRVQQIMGENQYCIYLVNRKLYVGLRDRVRNARPSIIRQHLTWNVQELWLDGGPGPVAAR